MLDSVLLFRHLQGLLLNTVVCSYSENVPYRSSLGNFVLQLISSTSVNESHTLLGRYRDTRICGKSFWKMKCLKDS